jgi:predicted metal-dependent hydrolase
MSAPSTLRSIRYGEVMIRFRIRTHPERTAPRIAIHVEPEGSVLVDAPAQATDAAILAAVQRRAGWISRRLVESRRRMAHALPREHVSGESLLYLGRRYRLKVILDAECAVTARMRGGCIEVRAALREPALIRAALDDWYALRAREVLIARLASIAASLNGVGTAPPLRLRPMKRQWGSCSPAGRLTLNPQLVKAPRECIDYVIVHELCHLQAHNHGPEFHRLLDARMPGWRAAKARLDDLVEELMR